MAHASYKSSTQMKCPPRSADCMDDLSQLKENALTGAAAQTGMAKCKRAAPAENGY